MRPRLGLGGCLGIAFAIVAAVVSAAVSEGVSRSVAQDLRDRALSEAKHLSLDINHSIDLAIAQRLDRIRAVAGRLGQEEGLAGGNTAAWTEALQSVLADSGWVALLDRRGRVISASGNGPSVGQPYPAAPPLEGTRRLIVTATGGQGQGYLLTHALLGADGQPVGQILLGVRDSWLVAVVDEVLSSHGLNDGEQVLVTDGSGKLLGHSPASDPLPGDGRFSLDRETFTGLRAWPDGVVALSAVLAPHLSSRTPVFGWQVAVRENLESTLAPAERVRKRIYAWGLGLTLAGGLLGLIADRLLARPLRRLTATARQIADGQLAVPLPAVGRVGEIAELSKALRDMVATLRGKEARTGLLNNALAKHICDSEADFRVAQAGQMATEARLRAVIESALDGVLIIDGHGVIETGSPACQSVFGWRPEEIQGRSLFMLMPAEWHEPHRQLFSRPELVTAEKIEAHPRSLRGLRKDGSQFPMEMSLVMVEVGERPLYVATVRDVSERIVAEEKLFAMATQDALTGVRNRRYFLTGLETELARSRRQEHPLTLLLVDVDHFKSLTESFGHDAGDMVLRRLGEACRGNLREVDMVGRLGGETFVIALPDTELAPALVVAERLRRIVEGQSFFFEDSLRVTVSIGVASVSCSLSGLRRSVDDCVGDLMLAAEKSLADAKKAGGNQLGDAAFAADSLPV